MYDYYKIIKKHYGDKKAKRSGVPYINHIDEGLIVLREIGASIIAEKAYCIHPILQADCDLKDGIELISNLEGLDTTDIQVILTAMEYRNVANRGLSCYQVDDPNRIYLSPIKCVNDMLIADKVQNRKDFLKYHYGTHPRSKELDIYFKNWLRALGITEAQYDSLVNAINLSAIKQ